MLDQLLGADSSEETTSSWDEWVRQHQDHSGAMNSGPEEPRRGSRLLPATPQSTGSGRIIAVKVDPGCLVTSRLQSGQRAD